MCTFTMASSPKERSKETRNFLQIGLCPSTAMTGEGGWLIRLDARGLDQRGVAFDLGADESLELGRRQNHRLGRELLHAVLDCGVVQRLHDRAMQPVDDLGRR